MRIIFRADASREIGSGHVMRSSVLAEEAISRGYECIFVGQIFDLEWVSERISKLGFAQIFTDERFLEINAKTDVLVLDSYSIPVSNTFIVKENWRFVLGICDEITPKYEVDMRLRPGLVKLEGAQDGLVTLSGAEYVLIRRGIEKSHQKREEGSVTTVLVVGGGSDPFGFVHAITDAISLLGLNLKVHLFTNDKISICSNVELIIHPIGFELDLVAKNVDLVLTSASTSSLEFIAREIPTGVACLVDNQADYYEQLGRLGYATQIGMRTSKNSWDFNLAAIKDLLENKVKRESLRESIRGVIDLKGATRVLDALVSLA